MFVIFGEIFPPISIEDSAIIQPEAVGTSQTDKDESQDQGKVQPEEQSR